MNLKHYFYKKYFDSTRGVDLKKVAVPEQDGQAKKEAQAHRKRITDHNKPLLEQANQNLKDYRLAQAAVDQLDFAKQGGRLPGFQTISLRTTYPGLFTGSGYNHETGNEGELKLGFFFDHTTGLPILPGSSVKGVLRSVFPRFKKLDSDPVKPDLQQASELQTNKAQFVAALFSIPKNGAEPDFEKVHRLELAIFEGVDMPRTEKKWQEAQEKAEQDGIPIPEKKMEYLPMGGHDVFLDAYISKAGKDGTILGTDALTPHGDDPLKNPIPLPFLKVLPDVEFTFQFLLRDTRLDEQTVISADTKRGVFEIILTTFGAGAKTNVGYGQFVAQGQKTSGQGQVNTETKPTEAQIFDKKPRMGDPVQAKVVEPGKVEIRTKTEVLLVKMTGNCPAVGTIVNAKINGLDKSGKINQVSYQGNVR